MRMGRRHLSRLSIRSHLISLRNHLLTFPVLVRATLSTYSLHLTTAHKNRKYRHLIQSDRREWNLEVSKFILSIISIIGSFYILFTHDWFLDHPTSDMALSYPSALDFYR